MEDNSVLLYRDPVGDVTNHSFEQQSQDELLETMRNIVSKDDDGTSLKNLCNVSLALKHLRSLMSPNILFSKSISCSIQENKDSKNQVNATLYASYNPNKANGNLYIVYYNNKEKKVRGKTKSLPSIDNVKFVFIFSSDTKIWIVFIHEDKETLKCSVFIEERGTIYTGKWLQIHMNDIDLMDASYINIADVDYKGSTVTLLIGHSNGNIELATLTRKHSLHSPRSNVGTPKATFKKNIIGALKGGSELMASIFQKNEETKEIFGIICNTSEGEKKQFTYSTIHILHEMRQKEILTSEKRIRHWKIINIYHFLYITDEGNIFHTTVKDSKPKLLYKVEDYNPQSYFTAELIGKGLILAICQEPHDNTFHHILLPIKKYILTK